MMTVESLSGQSPQARLLLGTFDAPAYVRRGLRVARCREELMARCRAQRSRMLRWVKWRLGVLRRATTNDRVLLPLLAGPEELAKLHALWEQFDLAAADDAPRAGPQRMRRILCDTCGSIVRFNEQWRRFIRTRSLTQVNQAISEYNRYYLLEKECALRSPRLAGIGFHKLAPMANDELLLQFPLLPVPTALARK